MGIAALRTPYMVTHGLNCSILMTTITCVRLLLLLVVFTAVGNHTWCITATSDPEWDQTNKIFVLTVYSVFTVFCVTLTNIHPLLTQAQ